MMAALNKPSGKTAVVTGSSTGIGRAIAIRLAKQGFSLIVHGRCESPELQSTVEQIQKLTSNVTPLVGDFSDEDSIQDFFARVCESTSQLDAWINNAGVDVLTGESRRLAFSTSLEKLLAVDVKATLKLSRMAAEKMIELNRGTDKKPLGSIVNIGWDQSFSGIEGESGQLFSTTKGAIMAMTGSLAKSFAPKVRVNCVAPGWIKTEWGESASEIWQQRAANESLMARWGTPEDVANIVAFLVNQESEFINGQIIAVNGGFAGTFA